MLHELSQIEQGLGDLGNILRRQGQLDATDQLILLVFVQLGPARNKGRVEQIPEEGAGEKQRERGTRRTEQLSLPTLNPPLQ